MEKKNMKSARSDTKILVIDNTIYRTNLTKKFENRTRWEKSDDKKLLSFIPGTIIKVYVKKGQKVKKGEKIVILEAMKMLNKILIQQDGTVKQVNVKEGQIIPKGEVIIEMK